VIPQVNKKQPTMIARAIDPAGKPHPLANIGVAEFAAGFGSVRMHAGSFDGPAFVESEPHEVKGPPAWSPVSFGRQPAAESVIDS
jgi:hypothetical protein